MTPAGRGKPRPANLGVNMQIPKDYIKEVLSELPKGSDLQYSGSGIELHVACKHGHEAMKAAEPEKVVPIATPNAKQAKRDALRWLDESFDTVAGRYKSGMNDEKIATECGLSAKAIADLRAEFGYDLKTPPEIAAMQDVASVLKGDIDTLAKEAASRFTDLLKRVADLEARLARYEAKP